MSIGVAAFAQVPLLQRRDYGEASAFRPENMLREARRQKRLQSGMVPTVCILDPDGDIVDYVCRELGATRSKVWACYHTKLWEFVTDGVHYGVIGHAVGASFAVLVAEQAFVSGCKLLIGISSAGQIHNLGAPPYHILIEKALRDEGTSYHYLPPTTWSEADPDIITLAAETFTRSCLQVHRGSTWTTDAPFRETESVIASRAETGICAVEMEASALYAFARSTGHPVLPGPCHQPTRSYRKRFREGKLQRRTCLARPHSDFLAGLDYTSKVWPGVAASRPSAVYVCYARYSIEGRPSHPKPKVDEDF